jgi:hypothetical protein
MYQPATNCRRDAQVLLPAVKITRSAPRNARGTARRQLATLAWDLLFQGTIRLSRAPAEVKPRQEAA